MCGCPRIQTHTREQWQRKAAIKVPSSPLPPWITPRGILRVLCNQSVIGSYRSYQRQTSWSMISCRLSWRWVWPVLQSILKRSTITATYWDYPHGLLYSVLEYSQITLSLSGKCHMITCSTIVLRRSEVCQRIRYVHRVRQITYGGS